MYGFKTYFTQGEPVLGTDSQHPLVFRAEAGFSVINSRKEIGFGIVLLNTIEKNQK